MHCDGGVLQGESPVWVTIASRRTRSPVGARDEACALREFSIRLGKNPRSPGSRRSEFGLVCPPGRPALACEGGEPKAQDVRCRAASEAARFLHRISVRRPRTLHR